ncbi:GTP cyclohydrolase 1 type 2/Nif3 [Plectosphaerella plurivora]|uniref:ATP phosphoribosyltransferase n=1 Tax=Plectosphaerella plurivora TaxID=936078 RepID=A0A9P8V147_9PEZI|nr:GTP cyclohydrolase 1 type 2/Nif3 [Plectosphaerella plurivora]
MSSKFKLVFFVPTSSLDAVKKAVFATGAGRFPGPGNYSECAWQTLGTGQFRPGDAANPNIGKVGVLEYVEEVRVETLCVGEDVARKAVEALKKAHPYEEPGYDVYRLEDF